MVTDESLHGRVVISGDGVAIGEIARLLVDPGEWRVRALEVRLRRDAAERIGIQQRLFRSTTIHIPVEQVQSTGDAVVLGIPAVQLRPEEPEPQPAAPH